jgi:hypothetical protein
MTIFDDIARFGASFRRARRHRLAALEMDAMPPELQRDIGWPARPEAATTSHTVMAYWASRR